MQILTRLNKVIAYDEQGYIPVGNSAVCITSQECYIDALISTVDCLPTDIEQYEYHYIDGKFIKGDVRVSIFPDEALNQKWDWSSVIERLSPTDGDLVRGNIYQSVYLGTGHMVGLIKLEPIGTEGTEIRNLEIEDMYYIAPSVVYSNQVLCSVRNGEKTRSSVCVKLTSSDDKLLGPTGHITILDLPTDVDYNVICIDIVHSISDTRLPQSVREGWANEIEG